MLDNSSAATPAASSTKAAKPGFVLRIDVDGLVMMFRIDDHGQIKALRIGARETSIAIRAPLHWSAHAVAIAKVNVIAHADLIAVIDHRGAGQREQQAVEQLYAPAISG